MGYLTDDKKSVIPTFDEILRAHSTLGDLLHNHFNGISPATGDLKPLPNKLGIIAAPQPIKK